MFIYPDSPRPLVDYSSQKDLCKAVAMLGICIALISAMGTFGNYESPSFIATASVGGTLLMIGAGTCYFYVKKPLRFRENPRDEMVRFAMDELDKSSAIVPTVFYDCAELVQECDPTIAKLSTLFDQFAMDWQGKLAKSSWQHPEVIQAADKTLKIAYAIGCLTLEDLQRKNTYVCCPLFDDEKSARKTSLFLTTIYHKARAGCVTNAASKNTSYPETSTVSPETAKICPIHASEYYKLNTFQFQWRLLYNDFCDKFQKACPQKDFITHGHDDHILKWHRQDEGIGTFESVPGTY